MKSTLRLTTLALTILLNSHLLSAQSTLSLSSAIAVPGTTANLDLTVASSGGTTPAGLQWTFAYPGSAVSNFAVTAGPAMTAAGKTLRCSGTSASYVCVASGMNGNAISDGTVAKVAVTLATGANLAAIGVAGGLGATAAGDPIPTVVTGGSISSGIIVPTLSTIVCNPSSLGPSAVAACTVTMSTAVPAATSIALTSTGTITVPASVSIPAGSATASFNATAGSFAGNQTATVTGTVNGASLSANISLVAQISVSSLACAGTVLAPSATTTCTVTLTGAAPAGGSTVALASSLISALTVPASIVVPASATTATFTATATAVTANQSSTLTATLNGSKSVAISIGTGISVTSLACSSTSLLALATTACTVTISQAAPAGGATVALKSSLISALTVPGAVVIPAAATSANFTASALGILANQSSTISATLNGVTKTLAISVTTGISVSGLTCANTTIPASSSTACTVTLSKAAPANGLSVTLTSSLTSALTVPASVQISASATTATFSAKALAVASDQSPDITASLSGTSKTLTVLVTAKITVSSLSCASINVIGPSSTVCTVTLSGSTSSGGTPVALTTSVKSILTAPASVTVPAGDTTATFTAAAKAVTIKKTSNLTATLSGSSKVLAIAVLPPLSISSLTCASISLAASESTNCDVTLSSAAPSGGATVLLSSSIASALPVPPSVQVAAGDTTATFSVTAAATNKNHSPIVTAKLGTSSKFVPFTITGAIAVTSLACGTTSLAASSSTSCTVTLSGPAPTGGTKVNLISTMASALSVPPLLLVPAGATTATFTATASAVPTDQTLSILASVSGSIQSLTMSIVVAAQVTALQCAHSTLTPQMSTTCTANLAAPAPPSGAPLTISSSAAAMIPTPTALVVQAGATSATFSVRATDPGTVQTGTVRAQSGSSSAAATIALSPDSSALADISCTPGSVVPGQGGTCDLTLTAPASSLSAINLKSTNGALTVPASVNVGKNSKSASFSFTSTNSLSGWAIVSATLGGITKTATVQSGSGASSQSLLTCDQRYVPAGGSTLCELRGTGDDPQLPAEITISSSSDSVKVPATIRPRSGAGTTRFEVRADNGARQQNVVIEAKSSSGKAQESLAVLSSGAPLLRLPGTRSVRSGGRVTFQVSAVDSEELPLAVTGKDLPRGATLDPATGDFSWTPADAHLGTVELQFGATDAAGLATTGTVRVNVLSGKPVISGLRNGAGTGALAACSPGARMTLLGTFLSDDERGSGPLSARIRVRVNGETVAVPSASQEAVDFVCPVLPDGTPLTVTAEVAGRVSDEFRTSMAESAPGLFSVSESPKAQGLVMHARGLSAIPRFDMDGSPAIPGETIRFYATGLNCENANETSTLLYFGNGYRPITSITPSTYAGVCEVSAVVPEGVFGPAVELYLEAVRSDATRLRSNTISVAIDEPIAEH